MCRVKARTRWPGSKPAENNAPEVRKRRNIRCGSLGVRRLLRAGSVAMFGTEYDRSLQSSFERGLLPAYIDAQCRQKARPEPGCQDGPAFELWRAPH